MNNRKDISEELRSMNSALAGSTGEISYAVPEGYFEGLAAAVLSRIAVKEEMASLSPLIAGIQKQMPYTVPENFFASAADDLPVIVKEEKESLILSFIDKSMPYEVPLGYFANLPEQVLSKISHSSARAIPLFRKKWTRLAVAAMITGLMISGYFYFSGNQLSVNNPEWVAKNMKNVTHQEMEEFVKATDIGEAVPDIPEGRSGSADIKKMLLDVSDSELEAFLTQVPVEDEDLLGIN